MLLFNNSCDNIINSGCKGSVSSLHRPETPPPILTMECSLANDIGENGLEIAPSNNMTKPGGGGSNGDDPLLETRKIGHGFELGNDSNNFESTGTSLNDEQKKNLSRNCEDSDAIQIDSMELERLVSLSRSTTQKLHAVWNEMGLSDVERARQLCSLVEQVEQVFVQKVADECTLKDEYISASKRLDDEIRSLAQLLGEDRTPLQQHSKSQNLMLNLTMLRSEVVHFAAIKEARMKDLSVVHAKILNIWEELGCEPVETLQRLDNFLTPSGIREYEAALQGLQHDRTKRIAIIHEHINDINGLFEELAIELENENDRAIAAGGDSLGINEEVLGMLARRARELTNEKINRTEKLKMLGAQIQPLWEKLEIVAEERQLFFLQNRGLGLVVIEKCKEELDRLIALKKERMGTLVAAAQEAVVALWDEMHFSDEQRDTFTREVMMGPIDESTLEACEQEANTLTIQAELYRPILRIIDRYVQLCAERDELGTLKADPKRLLQRGNGKTLQEELKMEQRVKVGIPKIMEKIESFIINYEEQHGLFLLDGKRFLDSIKDNEEAFNEREIEEKARKKQAKITFGINENSHAQNVKFTGLARKPLNCVALAKDKTPKGTRNQ